MDLNSKHVISIDIGTTGIKTLIVNLSGKEICSEYEEYPLYCKYSGWAEQDPKDWWVAVKKGLKNVINKSRIDASNILAIGTSGLTASPVILNSDGEVLCNSFIWMDRRSINECNEIVDKIGKEKIYELTGRRPDPMFVIYKLMWIKKNEPHIFNNIYKVIQSKDYINYKLTKRIVTDYSIAATFQAMSLKSLNWEPEIFKITGIPIEIMPEIKESTDIIGTIEPNIAQELNLSTETKVVAGGADTVIAALGCAAINNGDLVISLGTCSDVTMCSNFAIFDQEMRMGCYPYLRKGQYLTIAGANSSGISLKWFRDVLFKDVNTKIKKNNINIYAVMDKLAEEIPPGSEGLNFLPFLSGERSPIFNSKARGIFAGINLKHKQGHFIRSILEGVALSIKDRVLLHEKLGLKIERVMISGGGAKSTLWKRIIADMIDYPLNTVNIKESTALGAAILAMVGSKVYNNIEELFDKVSIIGEKVNPLQKNKIIYDAKYNLYKLLYNSNVKFFKELDKFEKLIKEK
ncbi:MAG: xylulokinase [Candidatus Caldatribacteriota bacterium]